MNETIGQGQCPKCGNTIYSGNGFECNRCDLIPVISQEAQEAVEGLCGPPVFHGFQAFIVPQYEKDQGFSAAFRTALLAFLRPGTHYWFYYTGGTVRRGQFWGLDQVKNSESPILVCDNDNCAATITCYRLDKIVKAHEQASMCLSFPEAVRRLTDGCVIKRVGWLGFIRWRESWDAYVAGFYWKDTAMRVTLRPDDFIADDWVATPPDG